MFRYINSRHISLYACMYAYMSVCIIHIFMYVGRRVYIYTHKCKLHVYIYTHICMHIYIHVQKLALAYIICMHVHKYTL